MDRYAEDLAAVKKLALNWSSGWDSGDVEALLDLYADEPLLLPQGQPVVVGKNAIRSLYQSVFEGYTIKGEGELVEVEIAGDWGYFWSRYSITATAKANGNTTTSQGKSLFIVKRQGDNSWKITRLIDNSDGPV